MAAWNSPIAVEGVNLAGPYNFALELHDASDNVLHAPDGAIFGDQVNDIDFVAATGCAAADDAGAGP